MFLVTKANGDKRTVIHTVIPAAATVSLVIPQISHCTPCRQLNSKPRFFSFSLERTTLPR